MLSWIQIFDFSDITFFYHARFPYMDEGMDMRLGILEDYSLIHQYNYIPVADCCRVAGCIAAGCMVVDGSASPDCLVLVG